VLAGVAVATGLVGFGIGKATSAHGDATSVPDSACTGRWTPTH
jgi:hypothetical protein